MGDRTNWLAFTDKMKVVLLLAAVSVLAAGGNALTDTFSVDQHPWVPVVLAGLAAIGGYLKRESNPDANA